MNHENIDGNTAELLDEISKLEAEIERGETSLDKLLSEIERQETTGSKVTVQWPTSFYDRFRRLGIEVDPW